MVDEKKEIETNEVDLGFGYFSTRKTAGDWKFRLYDGTDGLDRLVLSPEEISRMFLNKDSS